MKKLKFIKIAEFLLGLNALLWLFISFYQLGANLHIFIKILLFLEVVLYSISFYGTRKKIRVFYFLGLILSLGNSILSITDDLDLSDTISFVLSLVTFVSLLFLWRRFR